MTFPTLFAGEVGYLQRFSGSNPGEVGKIRKQAATTTVQGAPCQGHIGG